MALKLEVGKYYRTRDGRKVKVALDDGSSPRAAFKVCYSEGTHQWYFHDGKGNLGNPNDTIIAEWDTATSPVRTVTRKEIVIGTFGKVDVQDVSERVGVGIVIGDYFTAAELRAAIATLTEIADALEENE